MDYNFTDDISFINFYENVLKTENILAESTRNQYKNSIEMLIFSFNISFIMLIEDIDYYIFLYKYSEIKNSTVVGALKLVKRIFVNKKILISFKMDNNNSLSFETFLDCKQLIAHLNNDSKEQTDIFFNIDSINKGCVDLILSIVSISLPILIKIIGFIDIFNLVVFKGKLDCLNDLSHLEKRFMVRIVEFILKNKCKIFKREINIAILQAILSKLDDYR